MSSVLNVRSYLGMPAVPSEDGGSRSNGRRAATMEDHLETVCCYLPDGTFTHVNEVFCRFFGLKREDIIGHQWQSLADPKDLPMIQSKLSQLSAKNPVVTIENRVRLPHGETRWMQFNNRGVFDRKGRLVETRAVGRDITERVLAQQALQESNERWKFAIEGAGDGVWDWNVATGHVAFSKRWKSMLGYGEDEVRDNFEEWEKRVHPEDLPGALAALKAHFEGGRESYAVEFRMQCRDGSWKWILARGKIIARDAEGKPLRIIGTHTDITETKTAKEREAHNLRLVAKGSPCEEVLAAIVTSIEAEHADLIGCVMRVNPDRKTLRVAAAPSLPERYCRFKDGLRIGPRSASSGSTVHHKRRQITDSIEKDPNWRLLRKEALAAGLRACWSEPIRAATGEILGALTCYRREPGHPTWAEIGTVMNAAALSALAIEREQAEQALRASEERFRAIFEQAAVGVLLIDVKSGVVLEVNQRACEIARLLRRQVQGVELARLCHPEDHSDYERRLEELVRGKTTSFAMEKRLRHVSGDPVWINLTVSPLWHPGQTPDKYMAVMEDITARKQAEANYQRELDYNRALITHTAAYIVALDARGRFLHVNPPFLRSLGYEESDVLRRTPWEIGLMDKDEIARSKGRFENALRGRDNPPVEVRLRARNGDWHAVELRSTSTRNADGSVDRVIVTGTDVTERNRLQQEVLNVVEREQARLGHDLHDGVGQTMTGIVALIEALEQDLQGPQREDAGRIRNLIQDAVQEIRRMSHGLSPTSVKYRGLGGALHLLAETVALNHRTPCGCEVDEGILVSDTEKQTHLFRIAQEAVNNALRHGEPRHVFIRLQRLQDSACALVVEDDGRGFPKTKNRGRSPAHAPPQQPKHGIGLRVMEYRANMIGASLGIRPRAGGGVVVTCRFQSDNALHQNGSGI